MANMTLAIPDELRAIMKEHADIRWSEVARKAIIDRLQMLEDLRKMDELTKNSKLTQKDVRELSAKINEGMTRRLIDAYNRRHQHSHGVLADKRAKKKALVRVQR